jgi:hypothetical protein
LLQVPFAEHVSGPLAVQRLLPALHTPQIPAPLQNPPLHAVAASQDPVAEQVSVWLPSKHCTAFGEQATHAPPRQTGVVPVHVVFVSVTRSTPQLSAIPLAQKASPAAEHCAKIGAHEPAFAPGVLSQLFPLAQVPFATHLPPEQISWPF